MKTAILSLILMFSSHLLMAQQDKDKICFYYDKCGYKDVAQSRFEDLYSKEKNNKVSKFAMTMLANRYKIEELDVIPIPILEWNSLPYKCGDNLEPLIAFKQDFLFQEVLIVTKEKHLKVGMFRIFDSYYEENRKRDSIDNVPPLLRGIYGMPVMPDENKVVEKKIHKYCLANPNVFVFMIKGLDGYWAVIDEELVKLVSKGRKIIGVSGSEFVCKNYGEQFINDTVTDSFRIGCIYKSCLDCKTPKPIKISIFNKTYNDL